MRISILVLLLLACSRSTVAAPDADVDASPALDAGVDAPLLVDAPPPADDAGSDVGVDGGVPASCYEGTLHVGGDPGIHGTRAALWAAGTLDAPEGWYALYSNSFGSEALLLGASGHVIDDLPMPEMVSLGAFMAPHADVYGVGGELVLSNGRLTRVGAMLDRFETAHPYDSAPALDVFVLPDGVMRVVGNTWDSSVAGLDVREVELSPAGAETSFTVLRRQALPVETPVPRCRFMSEGEVLECVSAESSGAMAWRRMRFVHDDGAWTLDLDVRREDGPRWVYDVWTDGRALVQREEGVFVETLPGVTPSERTLLADSSLQGWTETRAYLGLPAFWIVATDGTIQVYERETRERVQTIPIAHTRRPVQLAVRGNRVLATFETRVVRDAEPTVALGVRCFEL